MDRRTLLRVGLAAGGLAVPDLTVVTDPDPAEAAAAINRLRDAWPERGHAVIPEAEQLASTLLRAEHAARDTSDQAHAHTLGALAADLAQWLSLATLKAGEDAPGGIADNWATAAAYAARRAGDTTMAALAACRSSVIRKDSPVALAILNRARTPGLDLWALVMVELHAATAHAAGGSMAAAMEAFERAGDALDRTGRHAGPRPAWGDSLHHGWLDNFHTGKALVGHDPALAERRLAEALGGIPPTDHINVGAIYARRADAALALGDLDSAAALGLLAWQELTQVDAGRDLARVRRLSATLSDRSSDGVVKELADAVA